jgi:hypothetical protein
MSQNIYTEAWKKILRAAAKDAKGGPFKFSHPAAAIASLGGREATNYTGRVTTWGGKCTYNKDSAPFRDLRIAYETGSEFKNFFPGALEVVLNANDEILINHQFLTYADYIQRYRELQMPKDLKDEKYKFRLVQAFQEKWKKYEAGKMTFAEVMSGNPFGNLLYMGMVPSIFTHLLKEKPAVFEQLLLALYDESLPLKARIDRYLTDFSTAYFSLNNPGKSTGQDERTIATLLTFRYPERYTLFKDGFYQPLSKSLGLKPADKGAKLEHYYSLVQNLASELKLHPDILQWEKSNLDSDCYPDPNHLLLAQDIFYTLLDSKESELAVTPEEEYIDGGYITPVEETTDNFEKKDKMKHPINLILYGPPGTGKTYHTVNKAITITNPSFNFTGKTRKEIKTEYDRLVKDGRIGFCTFHQSLSYEDFIEGIKPVMDGANSSVEYEIRPGIFKRIAKAAADAAYVPDAQTKGFSILPTDFGNARFYKMSLGGTLDPEDDPIFRYCIDNGCIALGWGDDIDFTGKNERDITQMAVNKEIDRFEGIAVNYFVHYIKKGDYILVSKGNTMLRAIGRVAGDYEYRANSPIRYHQFRKVDWVLQGNEVPVAEVYNKKFSQQSIYQLDKSELKRGFFDKSDIAKVKAQSTENYVLIIDEINRGNIAAIFGELITLLEENKRKGNKEELSAILPYSGDPFMVPNNLYVIGTMNTADRSVEALDTALRRRFSFEEMMPQDDLEEIAKVNIAGSDIDFKEVLRTINKRLEKLVGRDHKIGHSYFMNEQEETWEFYLKAFRDKIIPLLQEYFYGDYAKMCLVIGKGFVDINAALSDEGDAKFFAVADHDALDDFKAKKVWEIKSIATEEEFATALVTLLNK